MKVDDYTIRQMLFDQREKILKEVCLCAKSVHLPTATEVLYAAMFRKTYYFRAIFVIEHFNW
jgi:hypothetical protein